jgi:acetylornithine deacetylase
MSQPLSSHIVEAVFAAVDAGFEEQMVFTKHLVSLPSLRSDEQGAQNFVAEALHALNFKVDRFAVDEDKYGQHPAFSPVTESASKAENLVGVRRPVHVSGRSLAINSHVDVVPTGDPQRWQIHPFTPTVEGEWLYGRGAGDMKAGLAASLFAIRALDRAGIDLLGELQIHSVVEEEITGNGAATVLSRGCLADALLSPEPTDEKLVRANSGVIKFEITLGGIPAHPLKAASGISAIEAALILIARLKSLEAKWNAEKFKHTHFVSVENPASLVIGTIQGGEWIASLPAHCRFDGRIGFYPGDDPHMRVQEFESFVAEAMKSDPILAGIGPAAIRWTGVVQAGYTLEEGSAGEILLDDCHRLVHNSPDKTEPLKSFVMPCYLDAAVFAVHAAMPVYVYGPVSENIHGFNERVHIGSMRRLTKTMALFIAAWCGHKLQSQDANPNPLA